MTALRLAAGLPSGRHDMRRVWALRADAQAIGEARELTGECLVSLGLRLALVDDAVLMVSELVTNALLYGLPPFELVIHEDVEEVICMIVDSGHCLPIARDAQPDDEHGRGLSIVASLSNGLHGCVPQEFVTEPGLVGKATWFALPRHLPDSASRPARFRVRVVGGKRSDLLDDVEDGRPQGRR